MQTVAQYSARIALDRTSVTLKLPVFEYLVPNLTTLANQLALYKLSETEVSAYVQSAAGETTFVPRTESAFLCNMTYSYKRSTDICDDVCVRAIIL